MAIPGQGQAVVVRGINGTDILVTPEGKIAVSGDFAFSLQSGDVQIGAVEIKDSINNNRVEVNAAGALKISGDISTSISSVAITDINIPAQSTDLQVSLDNEKVVIESGDITVGGSVSAAQDGNWDVNDISKGTQTNDVKVSLDNEKVVIESGDVRTRLWNGSTDAVVNADGSVKISGDVNLVNGDIQIGAVEIKDANNDNRVEINASRALKISGDVTATNLDIRDLTSASDDVEVKQATATNLKTQINIDTTDEVATQISGDLAELNGKVTVCDTGSIAGTVIANASTNLNTSALNLQATQVAVSGDVARVRDAVETIDNAISGNEMLIAGGASQSADVKVTLDSEKVTIASGDVHTRIWDGTNTATIHSDGAQKVSGDVRLVPLTAVVSGRKVVASPGTAEAFAAVSTPCYRVDVCADMGNIEGPMAVGDSTVVAVNSSQNGILIVPGNAPVTIYIDNLTKLYADCQASGDAVCYNYYTR